MEKNEIIDRIIKLLKEQGKKQKDLTDYLNITPNAFTDWKAGRIKSWQKHLPKIAEFLNVSIDYLLGKVDQDDQNDLLKQETIEKSFSALDLTEQEKTLIQVFRGTTEEGRLEMITAIINIKHEIEKKHSGENSSIVV